MWLHWAELCSVSLHQRSETAQWRDLQPRQHLLPLPGDTAGTHTHMHTHSHNFVTGFHCDSFHWLLHFCLTLFGQHLFMKGRIENIFTDELYSQFATEISGMLQLWKPKLLSSGMINDILQPGLNLSQHAVRQNTLQHEQVSDSLSCSLSPPQGGVASSRVIESYLWECKQLGAYSPIVLLNTLLFFCTKNFRFTTLAQHQSLSFTNFTRCSKPCSRAGKVHYLRYQRSRTAPSRREETGGCCISNWSS